MKLFNPEDGGSSGAVFTAADAPVIPHTESPIDARPGATAEKPFIAPPVIADSAQPLFPVADIPQPVLQIDRSTPEPVTTTAHVPGNPSGTPCCGGSGGAHSTAPRGASLADMPVGGNTMTTENIKSIGILAVLLVFLYFLFSGGSS